jgi:hypothetical protein
MLHVIALDRLGAVGSAIAALVRRDHPDTGLAEGFDLVTPGERDFRPAMAKGSRWRVGKRLAFTIAPSESRSSALNLSGGISIVKPYSAALVMLGGGA